MTGGSKVVLTVEAFPDQAVAREDASFTDPAVAWTGICLISPEATWEDVSTKEIVFFDPLRSGEWGDAGAL